MLKFNKYVAFDMFSFSYLNTSYVKVQLAKKIVDHYYMRFKYILC